ncbi:amino acid adenylation domain-containing protein [Nonomuraea dietziae]|uniref:non-ribosomal peptide synthetase n=1 Tax=Nonomuraea dietziae TaxID=65515 RepID=UPI0033FD5AC3
MSAPTDQASGFALPASFAQERLWFVDQLEPGLAVYNIPFGTSLPAGAGPAAVTAALARVVARHEVLRTALENRDGVPTQVVLPEVPIEVAVTDLRGLRADEQQARLAQVREADAARSIPLDQAPLWRARLIHTGDEHDHLFFTVHHVAFDAASVAIFQRDFLACFGEVDLPELPIQYGDFAAWQRGRWEGGELTDQLGYWRKQLADLPEPLRLSPRAPDPGLPRHAGGDIAFQLPAATVQGVHRMARERRTTPFVVLLAGLKALLSRLAGRADVVVGSPVGGRPLPELEPMIGNFVNTLLLRTECAREASFDELVDRVRTSVFDALDHAEVPYERLVEELRPDRSDGVGAPLHQVVFNLLPSLVTNGQVRNGTAKVDLLIDLAEVDGRIDGRIEYAAALFDEAWARDFTARYRNLLDAALAAPQTSLADLPLLLPGEEERLTTAPPPFGAAFDTVTEAFAAQVADRPDQVAVADAEGRSLTYAELDRRSNRLAHRLAGVARPDTPVAIFLDTDVELAVAVLAVLKAGAAYLALDLEHPVERLRQLLADSGATAVLTSAEFETDLPVIDVRETDGLPETAPEITRHPDMLAYVIYTSGSTGLPKGVGIADRHLTAYVAGVSGLLGLAPGLRHSMVQPLTFDFSVTVFHGSLLTGGTLHLAPRERATDTAWIAEHLRRDRIDLMKITPSHLAALQLDQLPARTLVLGGEASRWDWVRQLRARPDGPAVVNHYGPTETTVGVLGLAHDQEPAGAGAVTPIGFPLPHAEAYILDEDLRPVPDGVVGELCIGGVTVARGYLGRPGQTAAVFVPHPFGRPGARIYRTGDRARRLPGGAIEFLGRADGQVKIRGHRVEPGEVQAVLAAHPAVTDCVVVVRGQDEPQLVAYVVGDTRQLPGYLAERLPAYLIPAHLVELPALPLAAHGKVDRSRLPDPPDAVEAERVPPRGPVEELVAGLFETLLETGPVGRDDGFFALGGHSLLAIKLMGRLRKAFGVGLSPRALFESPTVAGVAALVAAAQGRGAEQVPPVVPVPRDGLLPASYSQRRLWFLDQLEPELAVYNTHVRLRLRGALDVAALERALVTVAARHETLRSRFVQRDDDLFVSVAAEAVVPFEVVEPSELEASGARRFDLTAEPPIRAALAPHAVNDHELLVTLHHVVTDAWSAVLFARELGECYAGRALPELTVQYADFAAWQRERVEGELRDTQLAYWRKRLAGMPERLELPADRPRPARRDYVGANVPITIPGHVVERLRAMGAQENASLFMTMVAALSIALSRATGQRDIVIGTPAAERPRPELESLIGCFLNTLVLRADTSGDPTFHDLLKQVRTTTLEAFANSEVPFEALIEELQPERDLGATPLVQVLFSLEDADRPAVSSGGLTMEWRGTGTSTAKFDLTMYLRREPGGVGGILEYRTDLFDEATAQRIAALYTEVLAAVAAGPEQPMSALPALTAADEALVEQWNDTGAPEEYASLAELLARRVASSPDAPAVWDGSWLTYAEFGARVHGLASVLRERGVRLGDVVGVCLPRSADLVVAVHAVVAAGAAYLPLDPGYPDQRLDFMVEDAHAGVVITEEPERFPGLVTVAPTASADGPLDLAIPPTAPAYLIYTSGSTGVPKGVLNSHEAIVNRLTWTDHAFPLTAEDRVLLKTTFTFDVSVWELFWPLIAGAGLVVAAPDAHRDPAALVRLLAAHGVTTVHFVPSMLDALLDEPVLDLPSLRRVYCSGEALPSSLVARVHERLPGIEVHNLYGPTEAAIEVTWHKSEPDESRTPIGAPIRGIRIEILDSDLRRVPVGTPGELCIAGIGVAHGYARRPGMTARQFVPDPYGQAGARMYRTGDLARWLPNGEVDYLGRMDGQVKIRGMRVEPGEIESLLAAHPSVRSAVVQPVRGVLAAYVVGTADPAALTGLLRERLPEHMIPASFTFLDELPTNANGKLDRAALPEPGQERQDSAGTPPQGPVEELVATLFESVLETGPVGREDGFFALGGHSLLAIKVVTRLRAAFGIELPVRALFEAPTVAGLAERIAAARTATSVEVVPIPRDGLLPVSYGQRRLWFLDQLEPELAVYNTQVWLRLRGPLDVAALERALVAMAVRHEVLRSRFVQRDDDVFVSVADEAAVPFEVVRSEELRAFGARRFDLTVEPPIRAALVRHASDDHELLVTIHHVANDAWSSGLFAQELGELYAGRELPDLTVQYADYAAWQRDRVEGELRDTQLAYWRERLAGMPERLELPTSRPRPARRGHDGGNIPFMISPEVSERLRLLGADENASLFMTLLAAFTVLLARHTGQRDIVVGTPAAERPRPELEPLIGFFLNTLVLRTDCSGDPTFRELIGRASNTALEAFANSEVPFEALVEDLQPRRDLGSTPLVQALFSLEDAERSALRVGELEAEWVSSGTTTAKFDLSLYVQRFPGQLGGIFEYRTDLFDADTVSRLAEHFVALLSAAVADPDQPVSELPLLTADVAAVEAWNATGAAREFEALPDVVARRVASSPDAPAVWDGSWLTYAEFGSRVNALASVLREKGVRLGDVVGVCLPRGADLIVAVHAVMAAGGAYLPLEPGYPDERLSFMVSDAGAHVVITEEHGRFPGVTVSPAASGDPAPPGVRIPPGAPAYLIYTSGSTGRPKGVLVSHEAIANRLVWMGEAFPLTSGDRVMHKTPFTFDVSVWELFWPLMEGAGLVVAPPGAHRDADALVELMRRENVSMVHFVPSMLDALLEEPDAAVPSLRRIVCSGEALPSSLVARVHSAWPGVEVHNLYGPTEAAVDVTWHACQVGEERTPIGAPIRATRIEILDADLRRVPVGAAGELCIGGVQVAQGYAARPGLTADRFVPDPFGPPGSRLYRTGDLARWLPDGEVDYLGRIDDQVKIRGIRVELGEIEAVLAQHPGVQAAAVRPVGGLLAAYVVGTADPEDMAGFLRRRVPEHMVPASFTVLDRLPVTANGKLDRKALPEPQAPAGVPYEEPSGEIERALAEVWAEVLGVPTPGAHDSYFALGGDSIRSLKIVARLRARGYTLALEDIFVHQTVRELAQVVTTGTVNESRGSEAFSMLGAADLDRLKQRFQGGKR